MPAVFIDNRSRIQVGATIYPRYAASLRFVGREARLVVGGAVVATCSTDPDSPHFQDAIFGRFELLEIYAEAVGLLTVVGSPGLIASAPPSATASPLLDSVFDLRTLQSFEPVEVRGYWPGSTMGGGKFQWLEGSTARIDGGKFFAGSRPTGRWARIYSGVISAIDYGAQPLQTFIPGAGGDYQFGGIYPEKTTAPQLSDFFATLLQARAWYPSAFALSQTIDHAAIQEAIEQNGSIYLPEGSYLCRHRLRLIRKRRIVGAGMRNTTLRFVDCPGLVPRQATQPGDLSYVYSETIYLSNFGIRGNWQTGQPFDDTRSGVRFPQNLPAQDYNDAAPLGALMQVSNFEVTNFAGHGIQWMEIFCTQFDTVSSVGNGGHAFFSVGGNSVVFRNCYAADVAPGYAGFRIYGNALLDSCTGIDSYEAWWGWFGATLAEDGFVAPARISMINCNVERQHRAVRVVQGGSLRIWGGLLQGFLTSAEPYFIFDEGYASAISLTGTEISSISTVQPVAHIKNYGENGASGKYFFERCIGDIGGQDFRSIHFDAAGQNIYGAGVTLTCPGYSISNPEYATLAPAFEALQADKIYLGNSQNPPVIIAGAGSPEGVVQAPAGSLFVRDNGRLYGKTTPRNLSTGWVAYSIS